MTQGAVYSGDEGSAGAGLHRSPTRQTLVLAHTGRGPHHGEHHRCRDLQPPSSLASYGPITLVSMGLTTIGALAFAMLFAALSRRLPADWRPVRDSREPVGNGVGFLNAWSYWITAWAGNAAIAVGWVLYVERFINKGQNTFGSVALVLVGLWLPAWST